MKLINLSNPFIHTRRHSYALDNKFYYTNKGNMTCVEVTIMFAWRVATVSQSQDYLLAQTLALSITTCKWNEVNGKVHNLAGRHHDTLFLACLLYEFHKKAQLMSPMPSKACYWPPACQFIHVMWEMCFSQVKIANNLLWKLHFNEAI